MIKPAYPISPSSSIKVLQTDLNNFMFHLPQSLLPVLLQAWTMRGVLRWFFCYSPVHMGVDAGAHEEGPTLAKLIEEMRRVTVLLAEDGMAQARL